MEAYNVPSFDTPKRRKGCVMDTSEIKASSEPYEPYMDTSREMALWKKQQAPSGATSGKSGSRSYATQQQEGFENGPEKGNRGEGGDGTMPKYYSGYVQDKNYYCKNYNICPETFEGSQQYEDVPRPPSSQTQSKGKSQSQGQNGKAVKSKSSLPPSGSCKGPLQPPSYEYPMTQEARTQYDKALYLAMNQETGSTPHYPPPTAPGSDTAVSGYSDEDLDQFLKTTEMKSEASIKLPKLPKNDTPVSGRDPYATPFAESMRDFMKDGVPKLRPSDNGPYMASVNQSMTDPWDRVWDMALFVIAGLLIILLMDQLFKLAMLYGMKRAFLAIEPLLVSHLQQSRD